MLVAAALSAASGCGHAPLDPTGRSVLDASQRRLARTAAAVDPLGAAPAERQLFMQAEGFFRYRFEPPPRNVASSLAVVAAAVTDLPAFQALAGSLDLLDLRLRGADGAIHLWETLLARSPGTAAQAADAVPARLGVPQRGRDAASRASRATAPSTSSSPSLPAHRSRVLAAAARRRSAGKARTPRPGLSLIPGLGQFYLGQHAQRDGPARDRSRQRRHDRRSRSTSPTSAAAT